jgi:uncharacterized protein with FMN-binding domain
MPNALGTEMTNDRPPSRLPVRGSLALAVTIGGLTLLLGFRSAGEPAEDLVLAMDTGESPGTASADLLPSADATATATASADASSDASSEPSPQASPTPESAASPGPSATPAPTATPDPTAATLTATGSAYEFRWGIVQVVVTVEGDQIVDVQAIQLPDGDRRSASISHQVEPMLRESALAADSADIDVVSGATYTSLAYAYSLQSALDQLAG